MIFFFFKQKTAYEMRISDWSSDVCSSDLDTGDTATLATAQDYADTGDAATLQSANHYTDQQVAAWEQGLSEFRERVEDRFYRTDDRISRQGAMTAASMQMAMAGAGAGSNGRLAAGVGFQDGRAALSVGYAKEIGSGSGRDRVCK